MAKFIGAILVLVGAILLVIEYFMKSSQGSNTFLWLGLCLVVVGYIAHIVLGRRTAQG